MQSNPKISFTKEAEDDITQILQFTGETWGQTKQDEYLESFETVFALLSDYPRIGTPYPAVFKDCRLRKVERPYVVYRIPGDRIRIIRVVHVRADIQRYLAEVVDEI
jgi:toxin ParE1/3/4